MTSTQPHNTQEAAEPSGKLGANYWRLWVASGVSNLGDGLSIVAYPWLASALTRNPVAIAGLGIASRLPWLLFTLPAGVITDRHDRRRLVLTMDVLRFLLTIAIAVVILAGEGSLNDPADIADGLASAPANARLALVGLYAAALTLGFAEVLRDNSAQTLMPSIVRQSQLERANGRLMAVEMVTNGFVGPPLAGLLLAISFSLPFFVDAGTFAVAAGLIFFISGEFLPKGRAGRAGDETRTHQVVPRSSFKSDITEGMRWLRSNPLLWSMALALGLTNGLWTAALAAEVLFVQEVLGLGAAGFGVLGIAAAFGGIGGSVAASRISQRVGPGTLLLCALAIFGFASLLIGAVPSVPLVFAVFVVFGFFSAIWNVITVALRQSLIPDRLLGRVNSVYRFFGWGGMPIGSLVGGTLVLVVDAVASRDLALRAPLLFAGVGNLLLFVWARPRLNNKEIDKAKAAGVDAKAAADAGLGSTTSAAQGE